VGPAAITLMRLEELTDDAIDYILDNLAIERRLSKWEAEFVSSITDQWERSRRLTDAQKEKLGEVWDRY
jgi:hypothetical protein